MRVKPSDVEVGGVYETQAGEKVFINQAWMISIGGDTIYNARGLDTDILIHRYNQRGESLDGDINHNLARCLNPRMDSGTQQYWDSKRVNLDQFFKK